MFRSKRFNDDSKSLHVCLPALAPSVRQQVDEAIQTAAEFMGMSVASEAELIRALEPVKSRTQGATSLNKNSVTGSVRTRCDLPGLQISGEITN
jgi:hypothetical protein